MQIVPIEDGALVVDTDCWAWDGHGWPLERVVGVTDDHLAITEAGELVPLSRVYVHRKTA